MMAVIFMLPRAFQRETYEDSEDLLIIVFIVAHDGCHFYAAENFPNLIIIIDKFISCAHDGCHFYAAESLNFVLLHSCHLYAS